MRLAHSLSTAILEVGWFIWISTLELSITLFAAYSMPKPLSAPLQRYMYMYIVKTTCMIYFTCTLSYPLLHSLSPVTFPAARMRLAVSKSGSYAQPESALGETMVKAGADLGEESTFGKVM